MKFEKWEELKSIEMYHEVIADKCLMMFTADWCPDCHFVYPFIDELAMQYEGYRFVIVDRDEFAPLAAELDIMGIPSFLAFHNGKQVGRFVSKARKTRADIEGFIEQLPEG